MPGASRRIQQSHTSCSFSLTAFGFGPLANGSTDCNCRVPSLAGLSSSRPTPRLAAVCWEAAALQDVSWCLQVLGHRANGGYARELVARPRHTLCKLIQGSLRTGLGRPNVPTRSTQSPVKGHRRLFDNCGVHCGVADHREKCDVTQSIVSRSTRFAIAGPDPNARKS